MHETLRGVDPSGLERSCTALPDSIRFGPSVHGLERAEVHLRATAYEPHRHDTYAIGITLAGVQTFRYRGSRRIGLPGQVHILHPDELHDGAAATDAGLRYRIMYIEPALIRRALGGAELPFVADPVQDLTPLTAPLTGLLRDVEDPISELGAIDSATVVADALRALCGQHDRTSSIDLPAVTRVREHLAAHPSAQTSARELERLAGLDRFALARQFRRAFGTSPDRYRTMRRLALARAAIAGGTPLAQAAADVGFADQSHMSRQFKRAYGLTPARWAKAALAA